MRRVGIQKAGGQPHHVFAVCLVCDWKTEDFLKGESAAKLHAYQARHRVKVDVGVTYDLIPRRAA